MNRGAPVRVWIETAIFVAICLVALGSFGYAAWKIWAEPKTAGLPLWRRLAAVFGLLALTMQVGAFAAFWIWPQIGRDYQMFGQWGRWALAPFFVAAPCVLAGKGASRWWLLSSSVLLFVISFFIVLSV